MGGNKRGSEMLPDGLTTDPIFPETISFYDAIEMMGLVADEAALFRLVSTGKLQAFFLRSEVGDLMRGKNAPLNAPESGAENDE